MIALRDRREWLEPDGRGGFASGPLWGPRTRRYHGWLLAAVTPPTERWLLVHGCEAFAETAAGRFRLTPQRYLPDVLLADEGVRLAAFRADPWPRWLIDLPDGTQLAHSLVVEHGGGRVVAMWRAVRATGDVSLELRPLISGRDPHVLHVENDDCRVSEIARANDRVSWQPYDTLPAIHCVHTGVYRAEPYWYRGFLYTVERERGLPDSEDLLAPGALTFDLAAGAALCVFSAGDADAANARTQAAAVLRHERARRRAPDTLARAAGAYIVARGSGRTLLAGYPWFTDWGRDTFIALRGLCLATGRLDDAGAILGEWAGAVSEGMLPNRFPDGGGAPEYNAVDASLWFIVAAHEYLAARAIAGERVPNREADRLRDACAAIVHGYATGTRYGIHADVDGLLACGAPGVQLTWMDAKVGEHVITPRTGKPVEIQALWINALRIVATWERSRADLAALATAAFTDRFWNPHRRCLFDVVDVDHVAGQTDAALRPNQIFAVGGLPFPLLEGTRALAVVDAVERELWTPLGLRTLAPGDPGYVGRYGGDAAARDAAYHQGTAWPWLLGPFVEAWVGVRGNSAAARAEARRRFLAPLFAHLDEDGLGHVSEIADGDEPQLTHGCPFQAWSLGELLRLDRVVLAD